MRTIARCAHIISQNVLGLPRVRTRRRDPHAPDAGRCGGSLNCRVPRALASRLEVRADLRAGPAGDDDHVSRALVDDADAAVLDGVRPDGARLGARPGPSHGARRPDRDPPRVERFRRTSLQGSDRVPAADPVGSADPAPLPHAWHEPQERGLPRRLRSVLAAPHPDDLRRPRRRPRCDRHRAVVRRRTASSVCTA